jgi:hypothetical protein
MIDFPKIAAHEINGSKNENSGKLLLREYEFFPFGGLYRYNSIKYI